MNYTKLPKKVLLLLATPVMLSLAVPASKLVAQSQTETKIRLMAEALRARDSGDLATAKTNLEQLLVLAPNDVTVQRLLAGVNDTIAKGSGTAESAAPAVLASDSLPVVVYDPNKPAAPAVEAAAPAAAPATPVATPAAPTPESISAELAKAEEARVKELLAAAKGESKAASKLAKDGDFDGAAAKLSAASASLPTNTLTQGTIEDLAKQKNNLLLQKSQYLLEKGDTTGAKEALDAYIAATSPEGRAAKKQSARIEEAEMRPALQPIEKINPEFVTEQKNLAALSAKGRSQYAAGAFDEAQETFRQIETLAADNAEAKYFLKRIAEEKARIGTLNREKTRSQLLEEVAKSWQRPGVFIERPQTGVPGKDGPGGDLSKKLEAIVLPSVSFNNAELGQVVSTLAALSEEFDPSTTGTKGVNLVLSGPLAGTAVPKVNITVRGLSLKRVLDIVTEATNYEYVTEADLVQIRPSGQSSLTTEQFPVNKATLTRMTGLGAASATTPAATASADPFAPAPTAAAPAAEGPAGGESDAIRRFLQAAGVSFDSVPSASLAYDGSAIIVTQTPRNIEKIRNILARYNDIRQVEIEAKFLDVKEGSLDELGISWNNVSFQEGGLNKYGFSAASGGGLRRLSSAFTTSSSSGAVSISSVDSVTGEVTSSSFPSAPPSPPGSVDLGGGIDLGTFTGIIGDISIDASLRALSRRQGSDLLSAPKVTVMSGSRASITVAQELRYPEQYGEMESDVGTTGGTLTGGSAGVTITSGRPESFTTRNVGVELAVTPTVEEDDYSISLDLNPRVTEFEGFVEYGGPSIAISGGTTVTTPSGNYVPIFTLREINTRVTVWDGATLVMGGLTREEVRRVNDKVPVLGDIPFIGRAFQSKGEASEKRNLLVFVTANLVSPGGSLKKQRLRGVEPSSTFQNPSIVTPGGSEARVRTSTEK